MWILQRSEASCPAGNYVSQLRYALLCLRLYPLSVSPGVLLFHGWWLVGWLAWFTLGAAVLIGDPARSANGHAELIQTGTHSLFRSFVLCAVESSH